MYNRASFLYENVISWFIDTSTFLLKNGAVNGTSASSAIGIPILDRTPGESRWWALKCSFSANNSDIPSVLFYFDHCSSPLFAISILSQNRTLVTRGMVGHQFLFRHPDGGWL